MKQKLKLTTDYREFIELLNSHKVDYLITGAWGLALHAKPRMTGDLDIVVRCEPKNAARLEQVMVAFGFGNTTPRLTSQDFLQEGYVIQLGYDPCRIDLLVGLSPVPFEEAWAKKHTVKFQDLEMHFLDRDTLIECKRAAGRPRDFVDIESLEAARPVQETGDREKHPTTNEEPTTDLVSNGEKCPENSPSQDQNLPDPDDDEFDP